MKPCYSSKCIKWKCFILTHSDLIYSAEGKMLCYKPTTNYETEIPGMRLATCDWVINKCFHSCCHYHETNTVINLSISFLSIHQRNCSVNVSWWWVGPDVSSSHALGELHPSFLTSSLILMTQQAYLLLQCRKNNIKHSTKFLVWIH